MIKRIVIENLRPSTPGGQYPAKAVTGDEITLSADVFRDGHGLLAVRACWRPVGEEVWNRVPMSLLGNDRWAADIVLARLGLHFFVIEAWTDLYRTWTRDITLKSAAGHDVELDLKEGALLIESGIPQLEAQSGVLRDAAVVMRDNKLVLQDRISAGLQTGVAASMEHLAPGPDWTQSPMMKIWADRPRAQTGAWYELFPRSEGGLAGTAKRLPAVAKMGFDVLYLPPIHPIGSTDRKGPNNSLVSQPDDPGSPWSIGSAEGGHTSIHPELGNFSDFGHLIEQAAKLDMEIALDYALQCSADHPWVTEHPEWFKRRPDGSIRYAENPPKKYQDIYPIEFWPETGRRELWQACKDILDFWIQRGVKIFRVDNPHTKPVAFWEWLIPAVQSEHPEIIFLAEAFTTPKMMAKLAEVGFTQNYTYFTWRLTKQELTDYMMELAYGPTADFMRPNFWPNTPDILSGPLRRGGPGAFKQRLVLAATMSPSYGLYNGYELFENEPASDIDEEYLNSEKYEIKTRDWTTPGNLAGYVSRLNQIRKSHPAFSHLRNIRFHSAADPEVIVFSKATKNFSDVVIVMVNLAATSRECEIFFDMPALGLPEKAPLQATDELNQQIHRWEGAHAAVKLDPDENPAMILNITGQG